MDFSALSDADLDTMLTNVQTHINRILTGAQSGTVGQARAFTMASLGDLKKLYSDLSMEKRLRADSGGDFIVGSFGEPL